MVAQVKTLDVPNNLFETHEYLKPVAGYATCLTQFCPEKQQYLIFVELVLNT